jgi:hypothetical protein
MISSGKGMQNIINFHDSPNINFMVGIYLFLLLLNTAWQTVFGFINFYQGISALVIYLLPVIFYWYFRWKASEREIRTVLMAMIIAGLIVGVYFVYDSYLKLALGQVSDYAKSAFEYSLNRVAANEEEANTARINLGSRSLGLLTSHSVSGAWVIIGTFATLALMPPNRRIIRSAVIFVFGIMLLLGLNFTTIIAFFIIMFLFEFGGLSMLRDRPSKTIVNLVSLALIVTILVRVALWVAGPVMSEFIVQIFLYQKDLSLGTGANNQSMIGLVIETMEAYLQHIFNFPITLLLGDGFSSFGLMKGGDIGFIESMAKFGLPFFLAIVFGFFGLIKSGLRQIKAMRTVKAKGAVGLLHDRILQFAICTTLLVLITEAHYTVWADKSILPIVFFVIAIYGRYLSVPHPDRFMQKRDEAQSVP